MSYQSIPRDGKIFDVQTADCLNAQIEVNDRLIDQYLVDDLKYNKTCRYLPLQPTKTSFDKIKGPLLEDAGSFYVENIYCMRALVYVGLGGRTIWSVNHNSPKEWTKVANLSADIQYSFIWQIFSNEGFLYLAKIENSSLYISGKSPVDYDSLMISIDVPVQSLALKQR